MTTDFKNKETLHMQIVDGTAYPYEVKNLIKEYYHRLGRDLSFQNIEEELDDPAVRYSPPHGELLVALENDEVLGMVAYHRLTSKRCEMKRLYLTPNARGRHLGERLAETTIEHAKASGYSIFCLFTSEIFTLHYDDVVAKQLEYVTYIPTLNKTGYIFKSSCIF